MFLHRTVSVKPESENCRQTIASWDASGAQSCKMASANCALNDLSSCAVLIARIHNRIGTHPDSDKAAGSNMWDRLCIGISMAGPGGMLYKGLLL